MAGEQRQILRELRRQLMLAPADVRASYADRLEDLLLDIDPDQPYPLEFFYFRITGFRPDESRMETHPGRLLVSELAVLLGELAGNVAREAAATGEDVRSLQDAARAAGVTVRTLQRWRRRGLVCRRYVFPDGSRRVGVRASALERFLGQNSALAGRSRRFRKLDRAEQLRIIEMARDMAAEGPSMTVAAARIAHALGRATETVRLVLKRHDRDHPEEALYTPARGGSSAEAHRALCEAFREGTPVDELVAAHGLSRSSIYRIVNAYRGMRALEQPVRYFAEEAFDEPEAEQELLGDAFHEALAALEAGPGASRPRASRWWEPPVSDEAEVCLFRGYNFLKFLLVRCREELDPRQYVSTRLVDRVEELDGRVERLRERLLRAHLPLVEHVAWQHAGQKTPAADLVAWGRAWLIEMIESFDYRKGGRFPSYATLELLKKFARGREPLS